MPTINSTSFNTTFFFDDHSLRSSMHMYIISILKLHVFYTKALCIKNICAIRSSFSAHSIDGWMDGWMDGF